MKVEYFKKVKENQINKPLSSKKILSRFQLSEIKKYTVHLSWVANSTCMNWNHVKHSDITTSEFWLQLNNFNLKFSNYM